MTRYLVLAAALAATLAGSLGFRQAATESPGAAVDAVFARWNAATPGCAVGVSAGDRPGLARAYGMANLEHDVPNTADTIFEAGSVSKQFTAAAVLLLARDGRLSLDDPVRKHIPELPAYAAASGEDSPKALPAGAADAGVPLTIRHMLTHTSGLRDWGVVAGIAGWPRGRRAHTHGHVLDIAARQQALNFTPGTNWSYSNTGYNLAAIIVARVSGQSFADFSRDRIFKPLGMTRTSWRDDYTRIVKHRAVAYALSPAGYAEDMPFENVHGNGGLLTTVGDLLRWNENFPSKVIGDRNLILEAETPGRLSGGTSHGYGLGLYVRTFRGLREVSHSGATAGYRAFLARYPDQRVSVAVLCNAANANPTQYARAVAEAYIGPAFTAPPSADAGGDGQPRTTFVADPADLSGYPGTYASGEAEVEFSITLERGELRMKRRPDTILPMRPIARDVFAVPTLGTVRFHRRGGAIVELGVQLDRVWDLRFSRVP